jgi:uncharacterized phiE125 gp8 family phage protein
MYSLKLITAPTADPIDRMTLNGYLRIDPGSDDALGNAVVQSLVKAATNQAQTITRRALMAQTWEMALDCFPASAIRLPFPPLQAVESVKYIDLNGVEQTLDPAKYRVDTRSEPGQILPAYGQCWPSTLGGPNVIRFQCGYATGDKEAEEQRAAVPEEIKLAMMLMISHWHENRLPVVTGTIATEVPQSAEYLLWPSRVFGVIP